MADPEEHLPDEEQAPLPDLVCGAHGLPPPALALADADSPFEGPLTFAVRVSGRTNPYRLMSYFIMPGEELALELIPSGVSGALEARTQEGLLHQHGPALWSWRPPERPAIYCLNVVDPANREVMSLNAIVLHPYRGAELLNGYRIGRYERTVGRGSETPRGFVEVTRENEDAWISPHFQLRQFVCKQEAGYPRYLLLQTRLLFALERMLEDARGAGIPASTFFVMSGYRTPYYNLAIGNETRLSRHVYGDAADLFVDDDRDGMMDDIDGDCRSTLADARLLSRVADRLHEDPWYAGGLAAYGANPNHGPFVHVDVRGYRARW